MVNIRLNLQVNNSRLPNFNFIGINEIQNVIIQILEKINQSKINLIKIGINQAKNYKGQYLFRDRYYINYNGFDIYHVNITLMAEQISIKKKQTVFNINEQIKSINTNGIIDDLPYECQSCNEDDDTSDKFSNRRKSF
jgi:hypothetical protein